MDNYSGTGNLGDGEEGRSSSNLVSGLATEHRLRLPGMGGMMLVSSTSPGKQQPRCRAASEMEVGVELDNFRSGRVGGPTKIARTDGYTPFVCREQKMQIQMDSASANASASDHHLPVLRNRSGSDNSSACLVSEGRPRLAPSSTNSYASSERSILNNDGSSSTVSSESRLLRSNDSVLSATDARHSLRFYRPPAGMPVSSMAMGREFGVMETGMGMHGVRTGVRPPFSPAQWEELEHQALIFKYMMACIPVPPELIIPIRKSLHSLPERSPPLPPHHHLSTLTPWSSFHMGFGGNMDPEPGRCRRTDGKKWRCSRDVVPDQKYCERHMHRGRHRSRKPVEGHTAAVTSQSNSISAPSSLSLAAAVTTSSNVLARPSISVNSLQKLHQPGPLLGTKNLSFTGSGSQIQQYPLQAAAGAVTSSSPSAMGNKDYRYVNGMKGGEMDEHILFSEASGSSTITNQWRFTAASKAAVPYIPQSKTNNNDSLLQYSSSPQLRTLLGQNLGIVTEGNQVAGIHMNPPDKQQQQQRRQQHSFLSTDYGRMQEAMREPEEQPLRHFFDEWPRSRNPWATDVEDETSNRNSSTTQLSISIPMPSSNFSATNSNSSPRGKLSLTSLKLSMSGDGSDPLGVDPIEMGLAVGMNMSVEDRHRQTQSQHHHHHQANWVPIAWGNPMGIGGPLAEVLQSSTTPSGCNKNKPGLNLMNDIGWKDNMNNSSSSNKNSTSSHSRDSPPSCMQTSSPAERGVAGRMGSAIDHPVSTHKGIGH